MFNLFTRSKFFPLRLNVRLINATFDCAVIDLQKQADVVHASLAGIGGGHLSSRVLSVLSKPSKDRCKVPVDLYSGLRAYTYVCSLMVIKERMGLLSATICFPRP